MFRYVTWKDLLSYIETVTTLMQQCFIEDCMFQDTTVNSVSPERYNVAAARSLEVNAVINCTLKFTEIMPLMSHCICIFDWRETETWMGAKKTSNLFGGLIKLRLVM